MAIHLAVCGPSWRDDLRSTCLVPRLVNLCHATVILTDDDGASVKDVRPRPEEPRPGRGAASEGRFNRGVPQERLVVFRGRRPPLSGA